MTDEDFDIYFNNLDNGELLQYLMDNCLNITMKSKNNAYSINGFSKEYGDHDLIAVIRQEMYEEITGRE